MSSPYRGYSGPGYRAGGLPIGRREALIFLGGAAALGGLYGLYRLFSSGEGEGARPGTVSTGARRPLNAAAGLDHVPDEIFDKETVFYLTKAPTFRATATLLDDYSRVVPPEKIRGTLILPANQYTEDRYTDGLDNQNVKIWSPVDSGLTVAAVAAKLKPDDVAQGNATRFGFKRPDSLAKVATEFGLMPPIYEWKKKPTKDEQHRYYVHGIEKLLLLYQDNILTPEAFIDPFSQLPESLRQAERRLRDSGQISQSYLPSNIENERLPIVFDESIIQQMQNYGTMVSDSGEKGVQITLDGSALDRIFFHVIVNYRQR